LLRPKRLKMLDTMTSSPETTETLAPELSAAG
jgi:hypothetical protein